MACNGTAFAEGLNWGMKTSLNLLACMIPLLISPIAMQGSDWGRMGFIFNNERPAPPPPALKPIKHPWRDISGTTNLVTSVWPRFFGTVVGVHTGGVLISGWADGINMGSVQEQTFFVSGFPFVTAEGDFYPLHLNLRAKAVPPYHYKTAIGGHRTVHQYQYGIPCAGLVAPGPSAADLASARAAALERKAKLETAAFKFYERKARTGDPFAQYRLAYMYMQRADTNAALIWLKAASAQGHRDASAALARLSSRPIPTP